MPDINTALGCSVQAATPLDLNGRAAPAASTIAAAITASSADDQEVVYLQDDNGGVVTQFMRVRTLDEAGAIVHTDFLLDGTTAYAPTGIVTYVSGDGAGLAPDAADLKDTETLVKEYVGPLTVTRATVLADLGAAALLEIDILVRQVNTVASDTVDVTMGGNTIGLPLGGSTTLRAQSGRRLADFSITLDAGETVNITAQGVN